ncbi:MAG TPA: hypothetical protein ENK68_03940 [Epsilonproteobacteria bacterium]|nr:hypothetical protein [Campylobacterota bacterium]
MRERLERYFNDCTYIKKGHYPVTDMIVYYYMGDAWAGANKALQIAISEGLLRAIEAHQYELTLEDVEHLFNLYNLREKGEQGMIKDEVVLQEAFTQLIEKYDLS